MDYWKANSVLIDYSKKVRPDVFNRVKQNFTASKEKVFNGSQDIR